MRAVLQRVSRARVTVNGQEVGATGPGWLILLGVGEEDSPDDVAYLVDKTLNLRVFPDDAGKMNRSVLDTGGSALVVSQFTLFADCRKGRRPSFIGAASPDKAVAFYEDYCARLRAGGLKVATGQFQAHMQVELVNDGPVTIVLDSGQTGS